MVEKKSNLKNFDLTVDEIKLERAIRDLQTAIQKIKSTSPDSDRLGFFNSQLSKLEEQLDELREHTLIR